MLNNLSGKQGFLFGLVLGAGIIANAAFVVMATLLITRQTPVTQGITTNVQPVATVATEQNLNSPAVVPSNISKTDKPKVELFVMSYCPYGMEMEQNAFIPAYNILKGKADISIKFVSYAMHGKKEVEENTFQYCAQEQDKDKYIKYLNCFNASNNSANCLKESGLNERKLNNCVNDTNKKYAILDKYNDQTTWLNGRYPVYPIHEELNNTYGVQGSPTLVINGAQVNADRSANGLTAAICAAFNNPPAECDAFLTAAANQPSVALDQTNQGGCGG